MHVGRKAGDPRMRLPECPFFLFGAGNRRKLLYRSGALRDALTGEVIRSWRVTAERILPVRYRAEAETEDGQTVAVSEDEDGLWLEEHGDRVALAESRVRLPSFEGHRDASLLRVLHYEMLTNIVNGGPLPNLLAYRKPWYRDAALVCMCLERTGNLSLVANWISGLDEPFDCNNAGDREPDNLGEVLYLISLVSDACHPLVPEILHRAADMTRDHHLTGLTDGQEHPVYQTKWLKFGLRCLGLDDPYSIPETFDSYSALFWMDYREEHVQGPRFSDETGDLFPYLSWAEAHFYRSPLPMHLAGQGYPLTCEAQASEADYAGMRPVAQEYVDTRICAPHTWHAAEMFLYLLETP
jgi:hypothetical protein